MKKNKNKGFVLVETISVSVVTMIALVAIYIQFTYVAKGFYQSFQYNNISDLYLTENVRSFILKDAAYNNIKNELSTKDYVDLTNCSSTYFKEYSYCKTLVDSANIKRIIITKKNVNNLKNNLSKTDFDSKLQLFIKNINALDNNSLRIIVEYPDDRLATLYMPL